MNAIHERLADLFAQPGIRRWGPAGLLAATTGVILGAVMHDPGLAQTGAGLVLSGIAVNLASGLMQPILDAPDEDTRIELLQRQLESHSEEIASLSAAALAHAGPELARVLPEPHRAALITMLERGMSDAGGVAATHAQHFAAALHRPDADWEALRRALRTEIDTTTLRAKVGQRGVIEDATLEQRGHGGDVVLDLEGGDDAKILRPTLIRTGASNPSTATTRCPDCGSRVPAGRTKCPTCGLEVKPPNATPPSIHVAGDYVAGDRIDVGDISDASNIAIGREASANGESAPDTDTNR